MLSCAGKIVLILSHRITAALGNDDPSRGNQRISMRINLEVLTFVDHIIATSTSDSECVSV